jgi:hypothetical protein
MIIVPLDGPSLYTVIVPWTKKVLFALWATSTTWIHPSKAPSIQAHLGAVSQNILVSTTSQGSFLGTRIGEDVDGVSSGLRVVKQP